jgi:hypothetical protein
MFASGEGSSVDIDLWFCTGFLGGHGEGDKKTKFSCYCKGNPNSLDEQLYSQDLVRGNPK